MTATDMQDVLRNLDLRVSRIEQILPTLATKEDLKAFATKEDLKAFATKDDLNGLRIMIEDLRDSIGIVAAHLADVLQRLPPRHS